VLSDLFRAMFIHGHVQRSFGEELIIPFVKDKTSKLNSIDNYRPITLISIISKVFENVLLRLCEDVLYTDELQFGFKKSRGCTNAIFTLRTVISHCNAKGSSVYLAALDIKKHLIVLITVSFSLVLVHEVCLRVLLMYYVTGTASLLSESDGDVHCLKQLWSLAVCARVVLFRRDYLMFLLMFLYIYVHYKLNAT